ncbi:L-rhamnose catabolism isomerase [Halovibrio sp. HP20-50]|uniref:L-rhamnose catabolism isomerase n=1 Tax=Halovibrio sp. HP20-59 TaxID=3080275 RepID=UPI00294B9186|nr:L-rhamnose catabolism isomerase [Halovibrio sp. HP20-59]MEA2119240.1 L-rhamnose catabolism isomerase [Halovibrio sp. HP20-59]
MTTTMIDADRVHTDNDRRATDLDRDYQALGEKLARAGANIDALTDQAQRLEVALPSWGVGTGGTRFARFPGPGEPRNIFEKLDDCAVIQQLATITPRVSLHIPWDTPSDPSELRDYAVERGLGFDAMNSNTFQDQSDQRHSYKHGSLTHTDEATRQQAIKHNIEVIELGKQLGSKALTVWIGDGSNFPGQQHFSDSFTRYLDSAKTIYSALPSDWNMLIEHKIFEPAFYSTVIQDWGSNYLAAKETGERCLCLVDLGHHAPNVNIEMIVARLAQFGKLGGFHFNDSKYGDDDLDAGSIDPYQLFLVFNELVDAQHKNAQFAPFYMLDQSHNVTDPIESLIYSAGEVQRAFVKSLLVDREALAHHQHNNDALMAQATLKAAFNLDVEPILQQARRKAGGAIDPIASYRACGYRQACADQRPIDTSRSGSGIV